MPDDRSVPVRRGTRSRPSRLSLRPSGFLRRKRSRGQALVEFALVLPLLIILLVMAIDFGRAYFGWVGLQNAARIGANYAASHADAWAAPDTPTKQAQRQTYLDQISRDAEAINCALQTIPNPAFLNPDGTAIPTIPPAPEMGDHAKVTLACNFEVITPLASVLVGNPIALSADAVFPVRGGAVAQIPSPVPTAVPTATPTPAGATPTPAGATPTPTPAGATPSPTPACAGPTASFSVSTSPPSDKSPVTATFANQSSAPPACPITAYLWTFGNGNTSVLTNPPQQTYLWNGSGNSTTYTITLQVTSSSGTHSTSKTVTVKKP